MSKIITEAGKNWLTHKAIKVKEALENAKKLAEIAKTCGADYVKYQCHVAEDELYKRAWSRHEWIKLNEYLTPYKGFWQPLKSYCDKIGIKFMCTPMSKLAAEKIEPLVETWKVASPDVLDFKLLDYLKNTGKEIILSSGMTEKKDQHKATEFLKDNYYILHCVSEYPCEIEKANLWELDYYDGLSDHTLSLITGAMAVAKNAKFIEKHFSYNNWGKDANVSLNPEQLKTYIFNIREAELAMRLNDRPTKKERELLKTFWTR